MEDYRNVIEYLLQNWSVQVATRFIDTVEARLETLSAFPDIGVPSLKENTVRAIVLTKHNKLYYQISYGSIEILNIFDTRQNPEKNKYD